MNIPLPWIRHRGLDYNKWTLKKNAPGLVSEKLGLMHGVEIVQVGSLVYLLKGGICLAVLMGIPSIKGLKPACLNCLHVVSMFFLISYRYM